MNKKLSLILLLLVQASFCMEDGTGETRSKELAAIGEHANNEQSVVLADSNERTPLKEELRTSQRSAFKKKVCELIKNTCTVGGLFCLLFSAAGAVGFTGYAVRYMTEMPCEPSSSPPDCCRCASETFWTAPAHNGHNTEITMTIPGMDWYDYLMDCRIAQEASDPLKYGDMWWIFSKAAARVSDFNSFCYPACQFPRGISKNTTLKNSLDSYVTVPKKFSQKMYYMICENTNSSQKIFEHWKKDENEFAQVPSPNPKYLLALSSFNITEDIAPYFFLGFCSCMFDEEARNELVDLIENLPEVRCTDGFPCKVDTIRIVGCRDTSLVTVTQNATHTGTNNQVKKQKVKYKHRRRS